MKEFEDIIILIPAYKPANELIKLVLALTAEHFSKFIVVDDGSGKEYSDVFGALPDTVVLLKHPENRGKGSALKTGLKYIYGNYRNSLGVITCDADGQHTPEDICKVAQVLAEKESLSLILGSRTFQGDVPLRSSLLAIPLFWSKLITEILLFALSYLVQKKWIFTEECFV